MEQEERILALGIVAAWADSAKYSSFLVQVEIVTFFPAAK